MYAQNIIAIQIIQIHIYIYIYVCIFQIQAQIYVYVDRYSLPVNFQAVVMKPHRRSQKKLTETFNQMYGHLDSKYIASKTTDGSVSGGIFIVLGNGFRLVHSMTLVAALLMLHSIVNPR